MAPAILPDNFDHQNRVCPPTCQRLFLLFFAGQAAGRINARWLSSDFLLNCLDSGKAVGSMGLHIIQSSFKREA
jgi:hypothetical protein